MAINIPSIKAKIVTEDLKPTQVFFRLISSITSFINEQPIILDFPDIIEDNIKSAAFVSLLVVNLSISIQYPLKPCF